MPSRINNYVNSRSVYNLVAAAATDIIDLVLRAHGHVRRGTAFEKEIEVNLLIDSTKIV